MRFIHIADVHFDIPFTTLAGKDNLANERRLEQREVFKKVTEYIKENKIPYLFISGDLYEQEYVKESTIEFINNLFSTILETKIFIAPGNHDPLLKNSFYNNFKWSNNVTIFNENIKTIELEEADIYGFGFSDFYCSNSKIEEIKIKNKEKINILIAHGALDASKTIDMQYNPIKTNKLKQIGFDYVALGHIHKANYLNNENNFIYPGSLIYFGFDELGEHGMLDVEINKNKLNNEENNKIKINNLNYEENNDKNEINNLNYEENNNKNKLINLNNGKIKNNYLNNKKIKFIKLDNRIFEEKNLDISTTNSEEELIEKINNLDLEENKSYKIVLTGYKKIEISLSKIKKLIAKKNVIKIKDESKIEYDIEFLSKQNNLKGIYLRKIISKKEEGIYTEEEMQKAIEMCLSLF